MFIGSLKNKENSCKCVYFVANQELVFMIPFVNIHTHKPIKSPIEVINLPVPSAIKDYGFYSFGIHPWDIARIDVEASLLALKEICAEKKIIALGEIGLDKAIDTALENQIGIFIQQINLANQHQLPVIIHAVRAWNELLSLSKQYGAVNPWIYHGFSGNESIARQIFNRGHYVSFGATLLKNPKLQQVFTKLPLEFVFFETDDSEVNIASIYEKAAELRDICVDEFKEIIWQNFGTVFKL